MNTHGDTMLVTTGVTDIRPWRVSGAVLGHCSTCEVTIQDDDCPGEFAFAREWQSVKESDGRAWLEV